MGIAPAVFGFDGRSGSACAGRGSAPWARSAAVATPPVFMNSRRFCTNAGSGSFLFMTILPTDQGGPAWPSRECSGKTAASEAGRRLVPGGEAGR